MMLQDLKSNFKKALVGLYPDTEIEVFFYRLTEHKLGLKRIDLALNQLLTCDDFTNLFFEDALTRLKNYEPIQYILGATEFYSLPFKVDRNVLIPRPETEELVDWILETTKNQKQIAKTIKILDIGTGSGCIAVALAKNLPQAEVWALDISKNALNIARQNADLNEVSIRFIEANILTLETLSTKFDVILSNPPYVKQAEKLLMKPNVLNHEPHLALFVNNENPLIFYDKIADFAKTNLSSDGTLFFEINQYFGAELSALLKQKGFTNIELKQDLFKVDRMVKAWGK